MRSEHPAKGGIAISKAPQHGGARLATSNASTSIAQPTISVITVAFNALEPLRRTLASVRQQDITDITDIEHIVVDGGSTDGSVEFLRSLSDAVSYWISEPDKGIYDAMNKGLQLANGRYVHFLNAGDTFLHPDTLRSVKGLLRDSPTLLMNRVQAVASDGASPRLFPTALGLASARAKFKSAYCHQAAFVRREAYLAVGGFDTSYRHFADFKALWSTRAWDNRVLETTLEVVRFPLDGVSSDWRRAPQLARERERLLAELGEASSPVLHRLRILKAHLYKLRMMIRDHLRR